MDLLASEIRDVGPSALHEQDRGRFERVIAGELSAHRDGMDAHDGNGAECGEETKRGHGVCFLLVHICV